MPGSTVNTNISRVLSHLPNPLSLLVGSHQITSMIISLCCLWEGCLKYFVAKRGEERAWFSFKAPGAEKKLGSTNFFSPPGGEKLYQWLGQFHTKNEISRLTVISEESSKISYQMKLCYGFLGLLARVMPRSSGGSLECCQDFQVLASKEIFWCSLLCCEQQIIKEHHPMRGAS